MKRLIYFLVFLILVAGGLGAFWYFQPDKANQALQSVLEFLNSPKVRGFRWPSQSQGKITLTWDDKDVPKDYADAVLRIASLTEEILDEQLGRSFVREVDIYLFIEPKARSYFWNNGQNEIHLVFGSTNEMLPPGMGGHQNHVAQIANHLAQLIGQVRSSGSGETPLPNDLATQSLATYVEMKVLVPSIWRIEKDLIWPTPYNYLKGNGPETYDRIAANPPEGIQAGRYWSTWDTFWYRVDRAGGAEAVGQVLNQAAGPVGSTDVKGLEKAVRDVTEDEEIVGLLRKAAKGS